jgi:sec-independent protein translocase protein TatA
MLGLDNPIHILFLLVLALLVFGAKRLPEMGRSLGSGMRGFKESLSGEPTHPPAIEQASPSPPAEASAVVNSSEPASGGGH